MNEPTATSAAPVAAPAPAPAAPGAIPKKQVKAMTVKTSFPTASQPASALDRAKEYLKDIPVLHARLTAVVSSLEAVLAAAKNSAADLEKTGVAIKANVARWEEEQKHVGHAPAAPAVVPAAPGVGSPGPGGAGSPGTSPISGVATAASDPAGGAPSPGSAAGAPPA